MTSKVHENEYQCTSQNAIIMNSVVQQKQKVDELEAEWRLLRNMVINLSKDMQSAASNQRISINSGQAELKEEDTVYQMLEDMDLKKQNSIQSWTGGSNQRPCFQ